MSYNEEKLTKLKSLKQLAQRINADFATKQSLAELSKRVDDIVVPTSKDISDAAAAAVAAADHLKRKKVDSVGAIDLEAAGADQYIYMVPKEAGQNGDQYDEYMVLDGALEKVGDWAVDLSGYVQKEDGKGLSTNDYTDADKAKLAGLEVATDAEVAELLTEVFGANE